MNFICDICRGGFRSLAGLRSHKKTHEKRRQRSLSPSNPFYSWFRPKRKPSEVDLQEEQALLEEDEEKVQEEDEPVRIIPRKRKTTSWQKEDLLITSNIVSEDADQRTPEYREKIRVFFDSLCKKFPSLSMADFARANPKKLSERQFQRWCAEKKRKEDRAKIMDNLKPKIKKRKDRRGHKDVVKAERHRFSMEDSKKLLDEFDEGRNDNPNLTREDFCRQKPKLKSSTFRNWLTSSRREQIQKDGDTEKFKRSKWSSHDYSARAKPKWPREEAELKKEWKLMLAKRWRLSSGWFHAKMAMIMKRLKSVGWEKWQVPKKKAGGSWFFGNSRKKGSGGLKGRFGISLRKKTRMKTKTILERIDRIGPVLYNTVHVVPLERYFKEDDFLYPAMCPKYLS